MPSSQYKNCKTRKLEILTDKINFINYYFKLPVLEQAIYSLPLGH